MEPRLSLLNKSFPKSRISSKQFSTSRRFQLKKHMIFWFDPDELIIGTNPDSIKWLNRYFYMNNDVSTFCISEKWYFFEIWLFCGKRNRYEKRKQFVPIALQKKMSARNISPWNLIFIIQCEIFPVDLKRMCWKFFLKLDFVLHF